MHFLKLIASLFCTVVVCVGCTSRTSRTETTQTVERERGEGSVGTVLSQALERFGCSFSPGGTDLAAPRIRWILDRDKDGATLWIEGDYTAFLLREFKKKFGEPKYVRPPGSVEHRVFVYSKEQCGVMIVCSIENQHGAEDLKAPLTSVGIYTRVMGVF